MPGGRPAQWHNVAQWQKHSFVGTEKSSVLDPNNDAVVIVVAFCAEFIAHTGDIRWQREKYANNLHINHIRDHVAHPTQKSMLRYDAPKHISAVICAVLCSEFRAARRANLLGVIKLII